MFIKLGKQGSTLAGVMDAFSIAVSVGLQYGIPLESYVAKFTNLRFEPAGMTDDPDVRIATSVMDYLFRRIALDYLPVDARAELGIFSAEERTAQVSASYGGDEPVRTRTTCRRGSADDGRRHPGGPARRWKAAAAGSPRSTAGCAGTPVGAGLVHRTAGDGDRQVRGRSAVLHLRDEDAPVRCLLPVRGLRLDLGLQLTA